MNEQRELIGYFSDKVVHPYSNQPVYRTSAGLYVLNSGKSIDKDVLKQLATQGMLLPPQTEVVEYIDSTSVFIPEKIDLKQENNPLKIINKTNPIARVSYYAATPYEGQLLYRSNLDDYFITENGYVLKKEIIQELGEKNFLLKPITTPSLPEPTPKKKKKEKIKNPNKSRKTAIIVMAVFFIVIGVVGYFYGAELTRFLSPLDNFISLINS